ncbi:TRA2A protein, partial [Oxylabes madagascariensis]|nr:TRA2A protein [Oxylabes madagascariensis]
ESRSQSKSPAGSPARVKSESRSGSRSPSRASKHSESHSRSRSKSRYRENGLRYDSFGAPASFSQNCLWGNSCVDLSFRGEKKSQLRPGAKASGLDKKIDHLCYQANPDPNTCLGVFGLSLYTTERDLREVFSRYGPLTGVNVVYDQRTGRSRGFAFVYFERIDDSKEAMEHANGMELDGRRIRVDYSITKRAHTPTPGIYMGRPTHSGGGGGGGAGRRRDSYYDRGYDRGYDRYEEYDYRYR